MENEFWFREKDTDLSKSNLDYLLSCITFTDSQDVELAKKLFDTFFFEMMMPVYNTERKYAQRSFMLILTGPENCRKTTFFSMLFPQNLRQLFVTNSTETLSGNKSIRDFATSLVTSVLVVTDEFEIFYNKKNDSLFKTYVTSDTVDFTPIYEKTPRKAYKNAVLAGTTNKRSLPFEQDSNRRLAMISVFWIDTSAMECINWHHLYRGYIKRGKEAMAKGEYPWKLDKNMISIDNQSWSAHKKGSIQFFCYKSTGGYGQGDGCKLDKARFRVIMHQDPQGTDDGVQNHVHYTYGGTYFDSAQGGIDAAKIDCDWDQDVHGDWRVGSDPIDTDATW